MGKSTISVAIFKSYSYIKLPEGMWREDITHKTASLRVWATPWHSTSCIPTLRCWRPSSQVSGSSAYSGPPKRLQCDPRVVGWLKKNVTISGWWLTYKPLWRILEFVSWDDEIPNIFMENSLDKSKYEWETYIESHKIPWFQTTNHIYAYIYIYTYIIIYIYHVYPP